MRGVGMPNAVTGWPTGAVGDQSPTAPTPSNSVIVNVRKKMKQTLIQTTNLL